LGGVGGFAVWASALVFFFFFFRWVENVSILDSVKVI